MRSRKLRRTAAGIVCLLVAGTIIAHPDDPKEQDRQPRYEGPGYREAERSGPPPLDFPQSSVRLRAWLPIGDFGGYSSANDCWGYTSATNREYAIIGLSGGTGFVEITDPGNPVILTTLTGPGSTWRDIKIFQHYAYAVSEGGSGIQVFDLSDIDNGNVTLVNTIIGDGTDATHNVALNEDSGYLYRTGGGSNGLRIYDLNVDPTTPTFVGEWQDRYVHDAQIVSFTSGPNAGKEIAFCCAGFNGGSGQTGLSIVDVTDKANIFLITHYQYAPAAYSHQGWLSADKQYFYLNDELDESNGLVGSTTTRIIDVSDLSNPFLAGTMTTGSTAIDHNLYVRDDNLMFQANYRSGLAVFDVSNPLAPLQLGYFDTYPENDNANFNGMWSCYPYFPSGTVIGSDIEKGLFIFTVSDPRLTFDYPSGLPTNVHPNGGTLRVDITESTPGSLAGGSAKLHYNDGSGWAEAPLTPLGGDAYEATFGPLNCPAEVEFFVSAQTTDGFEETSPLRGEAIPLNADTYVAQTVIMSDTLEDGTGWSVQNTAITDGAWDAAPAVPVGGGDRGDPATDYDGSGKCFLTDNVDGNSDVDGGPTVLTSAAIDVTGVSDPYLSYARWFTSSGSDTMVVEVSDDDGGSWSTVETVQNTSGWKLHSFRVSDHGTPGTQMRLRFTVSDNPNDSVVEAAIDYIRIVTFLCVDPDPADLNMDGVVNVVDLLQMLSVWGACGAPCPADLNGDGTVNVLDLLDLLAAWG